MSTRLASQTNTNAPAPTNGARPFAIAEPSRIAARKINRQLQPKLSCVPAQVDACALTTPDAPALHAGAETMTYGELNRHANQLANYLISLGVGAGGEESIVGLCLDRSLMATVCALGILKAGAAYLPLDPCYPVERLTFMLSDAKPRVLITSSELAAQLSGGSWQTIAIDHDEPRLVEQPTSNPDKYIAPEQLAYVIYTSGSTGRPKGVEVTHGSLMNLVAWHQSAFEITRDDRASLLAGVGFDAAVWETWPYLTTGASLHLPDEATRLSPEALRDWLVAEEITTSFLPTALAERVMTLDWPTNTSLRSLLTGAETLRQFPSDELPFQVINNYGPTECTVVATSGPVPQDVFSNS
ncbi:MAG TPA: AMP-binding protein, partial [Pyrinomonadaceae bacterium]